MTTTPLLRLVRLHDATPSERAATAWLAAFFFAVMAAYYLLRPLRETVGSDFTRDHLLGLFALTFVFVTVLNQPYMFLVNRLPIARFVPAALHLFALSFVALGIAGEYAPPIDARNLHWVQPGVLAGAVFYSWVTAFVVCGNALVWVYAVDVFSVSQGKRLFGFVAIGGSLGQIAASELVQYLTRGQAIAGAVIALELAVVAFFASRRSCERVRRERAAAGEAAGSGTRIASGGVLEGIRLVVRSPYLLGICAFVVCATIAATTFYYESQRYGEALRDAEGRAFFARINAWGGYAMLALQLLFTARVLLTAGIAVTLSVMAAYSVGGLALLAVAPSAVMFAFVEAGRRTMQFAFDKPAREVLFTPLGLEAKYKSKAFVDTTVLRFGDLVGAVVNHGFRGGSPLLFAGPLAAVWLALGWWLGVRCRAVERAPGSAN